MISLGIENLINNPPAFLQGKRLGILCNQSSVDQRFLHSITLINQNFPGQLTCIFSPQHGFFAEKQDNMIESGHSTDEEGRPVFSLYGDVRKPTSEMFDHLDILLVDLLDVGTRVYTFMSTLHYCLETAAECGKTVCVLDRPNPLGGLQVEGNIMQDDCRSFVGLYPMPMRHGLTFAELALFFNDQMATPCELKVLPMEGWERTMYFFNTGCPWVYPSPNLPTILSALVYPGQVIWEGTNVSEGRGTTLPFELFGAPFIQHHEFVAALNIDSIEGCLVRPICFEPTSNKWQGQVCNGFQLHVIDPQKFKPYRTTLEFLSVLLKLYPQEFQLKHPPYEYEFERTPIDLILGDVSLYKNLKQGVAVKELEISWALDLRNYDTIRRKYFLYK